MKPFIILLSALAIQTPDEPKLVENEMKMIEVLIQATEKNLQNQHKIKEALVEYQTLFSAYLKHSSDKETVLKAAKSADKLLALIQEDHLTDVFETNFISELTLFSQIAQKKGILRP